MSLDLAHSTSFDYLDHHARVTPDRIAITGPGGDISWSRFRSDTAELARALASTGLEPGKIVVVTHPDPYIHWSLIIAGESLGLVSASLTAGDADTGPLLSLADLVLSEDNLAGLVAKGTEPRLPPATPDMPVRIFRTSGSTATPKCMAIHRQAQSHRIASIASRNEFDAATRLYIAYPLSVNLNYYRVEACLRLGGTVIFGRASQDLITYDASHCWLLPRDMVNLLQGVRGAWPSSRPLRMSLGGGPVSAALHDKTAALLGTEVLVQYGTNETGFIGLQDRDGVGTVWPESGLKIIDESGQPLPEGEAGRIVVRTPGMVAGYLNDPKANEEHFREGWFFTDDVGVLLPGGRFRILGRRGEIINLGGEKLSPVPIEEALRGTIAGLRDVAITSIANDQGIDEICVAVVPAPSVDRDVLLDKVRAAVGPTPGKIWLLAVERLPIGASGKLQRSVLKDIFAAMRPRG